jgi:alanine racemase
MLPRRKFLAISASLLGTAATGLAAPSRKIRLSSAVKRKPDEASFDPWVEIEADAIRNNVREIYRFTKGCRLLAVTKNNANGIGLREIGPVLDDMDEVFGLAVVRVDEALALREVGVKKPIVMMALMSDAEAEELVARDVRLSPFTDDAGRQLAHLAERFGRPIPVHLYVDTGMHRVGMPYYRALPWIEDLAQSGTVEIEGTYTMFSGAKTGDRDFDQEHLRRFLELVQQAKDKGISLGLLHGAPSRQITSLPESHQMDLVRPGGAIYGMPSYRTDPEGNTIMDLKPVFRVRARVVRVERAREGDGVSFNHRYVARRPTWLATIPIGHTDGYPRNAADGAQVLIGQTLYPVIAVVSSNHTIVEIGDEKTVDIGDVATVIGPDRPEITPQSVAEKAGFDRDYWIMTKLNALLHRKVV